MAYALIAWDKPGATAAELAAIEADLDVAGTIPFFAGLRLYDEDGPGWADVMQKVYETVRANPHMEAMVVMPAKGARVGGWTAADLASADLSFARRAMNMSGSKTYPLLFKEPTQVAAPDPDWEDSEPW